MHVLLRGCLTLFGLLPLALPFLLIGPPVPAPAVRDERAPATRAFKVATWNIRSGMGIRGFATRGWDHDTLNCRDRSQPVNAWGIGLPQRVLRGVADDPSIVALALQEAWNCGAPAQVNGIVRFAAVSDEHQGVALLARYGIRGQFAYVRIDAVEDRWMIGGDVCLDADCSATVRMFSTHWGARQVTGYPAQAAATTQALADLTGPHLFMGDLNVFELDRWSPWARCSGPDVSGRTESLALLARLGYADAWAATQRGEGWTGMASRPGCGRPEGNVYKRVDYVFSRGLRPLGTMRFGLGTPGGDFASDHAGLMAEFEWPAPMVHDTTR